MATFLPIVDSMLWYWSAGVVEGDKNLRYQKHGLTNKVEAGGRQARDWQWRRVEVRHSHQSAQSYNVAGEGYEDHCQK